MQVARLTRHEASAEGVFGTFEIGSRSFFSLENFGMVISPGTYHCFFTRSPRFGKFTYELAVVGHSGVRIHSANLASQLEGCIALGEKLGKIENKKAILVSRPAISMLEFLLEREPFTLEIS